MRPKNNFSLFHTETIPYLPPKFKYVDLYDIPLSITIQSFMDTICT